jgi:hypothetical protein
MDTGFRRHDMDGESRLSLRKLRTSLGLQETQGKTMADRAAGDIPDWRTPEGEAVSCVEKIKVLNENLAELRALAQDALEDAVLMGCDERQVREVLGAIVAGLVNPYRQ